MNDECLQRTNHIPGGTTDNVFCRGCSLWSYLFRFFFGCFSHLTLLVTFSLPFLVYFSRLFQPEFVEAKAKWEATLAKMEEMQSHTAELVRAREVVYDNLVGASLTALSSGQNPVAGGGRCEWLRYLVYGVRAGGRPWHQRSLSCSRCPQGSSEIIDAYFLFVFAVASILDSFKF